MSTFICTYKPTDVFSSLPPGMCLGQEVFWPAQGVDKSAAAVLPPDIGEPGVWGRLVYNDSGSNIAKGAVLSRKDSEVKCHVKASPTSTDGTAVAGVALGAITSTYYGFMCIGGQCGVLAGAAGFSANTAVKQSTVAAGVAVDSAATPPADAFGRSHEAATSGNLGKCTIFRK